MSRGQPYPPAVRPCASWPAARITIVTRDERTERLRSRTADFLGLDSRRLHADWSDPRGAPVAEAGDGERRFTDAPLHAVAPNGLYEVTDGLDGSFVNKLICVEA